MPRTSRTPATPPASRAARGARAPRAHDFPEWTRIPGSQQRYVNLRSGATISRRAYLDMQAKSYGWNNASEYQRFSRAASGLGGMHAEGAKLAISTMLNAGMDVIDRSEFLRDPAHRLLLIRLAQNPDAKEYNKPLAQWLLALGLREPSWKWDVGDTPKFRPKRRGRAS